VAEVALQKSPVSGESLTLSLCGEEGIRFGNQVFTPDSTKAYINFQFSHAFPVRTMYDTALYPSVIAKSFNSLLHQNVNYEHQLAVYHEDKDVRDRVIGSIVACEFPREPVGGWAVNPDASKAPGISGVAVLYKQTSGMAKVLGEHSAGRRNYKVSMEVFYPFEEAGFAVELKGKDPEFNFTPIDMLKAGYEYVPVAQAPAALVATFSRKKNRVVAQYKGRKTCVLMGGLNGSVHYAGMGVVHFGAEPPARISRLVANDSSPLEALADSIVATFRNLTISKNNS
jgi:hypothetical protein